GIVRCAVWSSSAPPNHTRDWRRRCLCRFGLQPARPIPERRTFELALRREIFRALPALAPLAHPLYPLRLRSHHTREHGRGGSNTKEPGSCSAYRQNEASRALRWQGGLRLPRLPPAQASKRPAFGEERQAPLLPPALAVAALDAARPAARE